MNEDAGDHKKSWHARKERDDILRQTGGDQLESVILRKIFKWQNRNRRPIRNERRKQVSVMAIGRTAGSLPNFAYEPNALASDRPDQALLFAAVAKCLARSIDAAV